MGELLEYAPEIGLLVHDPLLGLVVAMLCGWLFWLWPELGVAVFIFRPHLLYNTEFTAGFFGYRLSLDHILMLLLCLRLWSLYARKKEAVHVLLGDPIVKYSLLLTGWLLVFPLLRQGWGAHLLVFRQIQSYAIPVFGILIFSTYREKLPRFVNSSFALLAALQFAFMLKVLPLAAQGAAISRNALIYGIPIWASQGPYAVIFALVYWLTYPGRRLSGWFYGAVVFAGLLTTVLGQSRGMWIGTSVVAAFILARSGKVARWLSTVVIASALVLLILSLASPASVGNLQRVVLDVFHVRYEATTMRAQPLSGREDYWFSALKSFARSPIWGVGYRQAAGEYETVREGRVVITRPSVHNYFLGVLSEQGLIGFILLLAVLRRLATVLGDNLRTPAENPHVYRWQLLTAAVSVYALTGFGVSYWAAVLALVAHQGAAAARHTTVPKPARMPLSRSRSSPRIPGVMPLPYHRPRLDAQGLAAQEVDFAE